MVGGALAFTSVQGPVIVAYCACAQTFIAWSTSSTGQATPPVKMGRLLTRSEKLPVVCEIQAPLDTVPTFASPAAGSVPQVVAVVAHTTMSPLAGQAVTPEK